MTRDQKLEILANALKGIDFLQRAQPGAGPMTERKKNRKRANELLMPYFGVEKWPADMSEQVKSIDNSLLNLV